MVIGDSVFRWAPSVKNELSLLGCPLPYELVLSVIKAESNGYPGIVNQSSGASGLMQVMPGTLEDYNQRNKTSFTISDLRRKDTPEIQIRVGTFVLAHYWKQSYKWLSKKMGKEPGLEHLVRIADMYYSAGPGSVQKKAQTLNGPPTFEAFKLKYPNWSAIKHANKVWNFTKEQDASWNLDEIQNWVKGPISPIVSQPPLIAQNHKNGLGIALIMIAIAAYYLG